MSLSTSVYHDDEPDLPETDDKHIARQRGPYTEPPAERQAHLRAMHDANLAAGRAPYAGVHIQSRDEVLWIVRERGWSVEYDSFYVKYVLNPRGKHVERANLTHANLASVDLSGIVLRRADLSHANLTQANLEGADLIDADLAEADVGFAKLAGLHLGWSNLSHAHLRGADLRGARLMFADLTGTRMFRADLRGANLYASHMSVATALGKVQLDANTRLGDIIWNGAPLTQIEWDQLTRLGDEADVGQSGSGPAGHEGYEAAVRAYTQLALALQSQGLSDAAAPFAYRARTLERRLALRRRRLGRWLFLGMLALLAGYGYRMGRILIAYAVVVLLAATAYYILGVVHGPHLNPVESLLVSITAFHGRVFANQFGPDAPQAWVTAFEAVSGLVIEGVFIAMLAQRFFGK